MPGTSRWTSATRRWFSRTATCCSCSTGTPRPRSIMIDSASGILPDGTVFSIPDQDALPDPLHPQNFPDERSRNIYLALPVASDVRNEISDGRRIGRYRLNYADVRDLHSEEGDARTLTLGQLTPRIMSGAEDMSAYITLPLCRISDRSPQAVTVHLVRRWATILWLMRCRMM